ncbi:MAG: DNA adenine methylase [Gammaproteobacteria bacterium]|nr:DNA adenine methylase [Gammaproteobacteria bacterium]
MGRYNTPLRYPGGKAKLSSYIKEIFELNNLCDGHYMEPYAGGAGIALDLLMDEYVTHIHLNDLNYPLYSFWHCVLNDTESLCRRIKNCRVTINVWNRQKKIINHPGEHSLFELGFALFFLNRVNRSGIISGGVIGGKNQDGPWKIDARFNKDGLIDRIERIADYKDRISIYNLDASDLIKNVIPVLPKKSLIYLDPPYYVKGQELYDNHYGHKDHALIAQLVQNKIKHPWMVSYDNTPQIHEFYRESRRATYSLNYHAAQPSKGSEVMVYSEQLILPEDNNPGLKKAS